MDKQSLAIPKNKDVDRRRSQLYHENLVNLPGRTFLFFDCWEGTDAVADAVWGFTFCDHRLFCLD